VQLFLNIDTASASTSLETTSSGKKTSLKTSFVGKTASLVAPMQKNEWRSHEKTMLFVLLGSSTNLRSAS
jgi:hypothetical protein